MLLHRRSIKEPIELLIITTELQLVHDLSLREEAWREPVLLHQVARSLG